MIGFHDQSAIPSASASMLLWGLAGAPPAAGSSPLSLNTSLLRLHSFLAASKMTAQGQAPRDASDGILDCNNFEE